MKSKKYLRPLAILSPEFGGGVVVAYLAEGRMRLPKDATMFEINDTEMAGGPKVRILLPGETAPGKPAETHGQP